MKLSLGFFVFKLLMHLISLNLTLIWHSAKGLSIFSPRKQLQKIVQKQRISKVSFEDSLLVMTIPKVITVGTSTGVVKTEL